MKVEVEATEKPGKLAENLRQRGLNVEEGEKIVVETGDTGILERTPGVESYTVEGERIEGLKGRPVQEQAYARIETREDVAKALLATINGYDLRVLDTERTWDLKLLKRFNPDIKELKFDTPKEELGIEKSVSGLEGTESLDIELEDGEVETVYSFLMP